MHFLVNIPEVTEMPKDCHHCPFRYMDVCGKDRCKLSERIICDRHNKKLNDCRIAIDKPFIAFPITVHPEKPKDDYYMECSNENTTYFITFEDGDEVYEDMDIWNGEGD